MKLKKFIAAKVHGYLNFDIKFDDQVTFLVGTNGSGKSTALALMEALLAPSLKDLALIEFESARVEFEDSGSNHVVEVFRNEESLTIRASWVEEISSIRALDKKRRGLLQDDLVAADDYFGKLALEYSSEPALRAISELAAPVFLGIDRQHRSDLRDGSLSPSVRSLRMPQENRGTRRLLRGNLAAGLLDTQILVQEGYRTARRQLDSAQERLRTDVLLSAFKYSDIEKDDSGKAIFDFSAHTEILELQKSKDDLSKALSELGVPRLAIDERVNGFFSKLSLLNKRMDGLDRDDSGTTVVEYLTNKGHVDRLRDLIALIQDFNKKTGKVFGKVDQFKSFMNWFYSDSRKEVDVDQVGRLLITRQHGAQVPLDALSSGERQLLIIFSHIFFNAYALRSRVFVIDEPELSLHMRWQENLVDKIRAASPDSQLVFATHSPEIVGDLKSRCVQV